ncbi:uncharacterized protein PITG_15416 [Phytophthora infestans T30-4]|uniref:Ubiquitin-like domain-containing protein n=1 Tax=Phytophthora infestans (strain T30-4) TaxID=403677 RepID=D0NR73_PHYIT|nr:uncharacterized protein PITG_15416 [Phytophthora infestans T30-4]EEY63195.1 conserved hypothetical protein [Phytophthora infestans T30-4]|eukprot:XP_002898372.1 conserved hypothetical protein [Phytophthora infestans T30-4]
MGPYIRVKRRNQTVFLDVQLADSFLSVKEKLGSLFHLPPTSIQLWQGLNQVDSDLWEDLSVTKVEAVDAGDASPGGAAGSEAKAE